MDLLPLTADIGLSVRGLDPTAPVETEIRGRLRHAFIDAWGLVHAYFHEWRENDLVLWDNWRTLHCAGGVPEACTREMQRTTITRLAGD